MKKLYFLLIFSTIFSSCGDRSRFKLGYTPLGIPVTLSINGNGVPSIEFNGRISTSIGSFSISYDDYVATNHRTYIELISNNENRKYVFELMNDGEKVIWETSNYTINTVENKKFSTIVTVQSDEISDVLCKRQDPSAKPHFPEQAFSYFFLTKKINEKVSWEINNVWDFFGVIFYGLILFFCILIDILIIMLSFIIRLFWGCILLIANLFK